MFYKGVSPHHLCFGRDSEAGRGAGKVDWKEGKVAGVPSMEAVGMGKL